MVVSKDADMAGGLQAFTEDKYPKILRNAILSGGARGVVGILAETPENTLESCLAIEGALRLG